jgi:CelD/BcsL family acetyltransferase involved in cellulose biosynthesis
MNGPTVRVIPAADLSEFECERWAELQDADHALASPFFSPDFVRCASPASPNVFVAILEIGDRQVGFFSFERSGRSGHPVGRRFAYHQGVVLERGIELDPVALVRACGLKEWRFSHLLASQACFAPFHRIRGGSACIDLSDGFDAYVAERKRSGSKLFSGLAKRERRIERDVGPLRFVAQADDLGVAQEIIRLKLDHYARTHGQNLLAIESYLALLTRMLAAQTPRFAGVVSALYASDRLVAGLLGVRSRTVYVGIVATYDQEFAYYSPGGILYAKMCETLPALGITTLDLGGSEHEYKQRWSSGEVELAEGFVARDHVTRAKLELEAGMRARTFHLLNHGVLGPDRRAGQALRKLRHRGSTSAAGSS